MSKGFDNIRGTDVISLSVLKKRPDFLRIAAGRIKWVSKSMIVQFAPTPEGEKPSSSHIRVGYTASKKVGNAVKRNRAKRRLRDVVRNILPNKGMVGHDYVLIARRTDVEIPYDGLIRDFIWCLRCLSRQTHARGSVGSKDEKTGLSAPHKGLEVMKE